MKFEAPRVTFGPARPNAAAVPPATLTRAAARGTALLAEAADVLTVLPGPGEALHALLTGRYDLMHLLVVLVERLGAIEVLRVATLSYNGRNLAELLTLLDGGKVRTLTLLCSAFFRDHNPDLWEHTLDEFRTRGQRAAAARSHAKVVTLVTAGGEPWVLEGSANLRGNGNWEQLTVIRNAAGLHHFHSAWIDDLVAHEGQGE